MRELNIVKKGSFAYLAPMQTILFGILFLGSYLISSEPVWDQKIYHNKYGSYYVPKGHNRIAVNMIKKGEVYEANTLRYISEIYEEGTDIVHLGTYFGDMLPFFSKLSGENTVWAFEPVRDNYLCAAKNVELNCLQNVQLFNLALSDHPSQLYMRTAKSGIACGGSSQIIPGHPEKKDETFECVKSMTLDQILRDNGQRVGIIHLDVEGHELEVLRGARDTIGRYKPILILEIWPSNKARFLHELKEMGYQPFKELDENTFFAPIES